MPPDTKENRDALTERKRTLLTWSCGASPWVLFLLVVMLAVHVRLGLGHWPRPMWETYETTAFNLHLLAVWSLAWLSLFAAPPSWLVLLCFRRFRLSVPVHLMQAVAFGCGWLAVYFGLKHDPTPFTQWLLD